MKRTALFIILISLAVFCCGCAKKTYQLPWDQFCYWEEGSQEVPLDSEAREYVIDCMNQGEWSDGQVNCDHDFVFYTKEQSVAYHSECGTFSDLTNGKSMTVSEEQRTKINGYLSLDELDKIVAE